jgi:hypothetical protein
LGLKHNRATPWEDNVDRGGCGSHI